MRKKSKSKGNFLISKWIKNVSLFFDFFVYLIEFCKLIVKHVSLLCDIEQRGVNSESTSGVGQLTKKTPAQSCVKTRSSARSKCMKYCVAQRFSWHLHAYFKNIHRMRWYLSCHSVINRNIITINFNLKHFLRICK